MRGLQPSFEVDSNIPTLLGDIIGNDNILHTQFGAHPADIAPTKISHHTPVIGIGDRIHL